MPILATRRILGNNVAPATKPLPTVPYEKALRLALTCPFLEAYSRETKELVSPDQSNYDHPFIAAVNTAYARHYPLVLSPDMIWLLIAQGFACHVNNNAETLRARFVAHQGKIELIVERQNFVLGFTGNDWEGVFTEFSEKIRDHIGEKAHRVIVPAFSTTGIVEKAAFEVTLMDAMHSYFDYTVEIICGIPWFALEGTPDDWKRLRDNAAGLAQYNLEWWMPYLLPVLDEFVAASEGHPTPTFWPNFCYSASGRGCIEPSGITGLVNNLFPYVNDKDCSIEFLSADEAYAGREAIQKEISLIEDPDEYMERMKYLMRRLYRTHSVPSRRNPCLNNIISDSTRGQDGVQSDEFPSALSSAPFLLTIKDGGIYPMKFIAGFVGFAQDRETLAIRPEIGWAVVKKE